MKADLRLGGREGGGASESMDTRDMMKMMNNLNEYYFRKSSPAFRSELNYKKLVRRDV